MESNIGIKKETIYTYIGENKDTLSSTNIYRFNRKGQIQKSIEVFHKYSDTCYIDYTYENDRVIGKSSICNMDEGDTTFWKAIAWDQNSNMSEVVLLSDTSTRYTYKVDSCTSTSRTYNGVDQVYYLKKTWKNGRIQSTIADFNRYISADSTSQEHFETSYKYNKINSRNDWIKRVEVGPNRIYYQRRELEYY